MTEKLTTIYLIEQKVLATLSEDKCKYIIKFCQDLCLIARKYECPKCGKSMNLVKTNVVDGYSWACRAYGPSAHHVKRSVRSGSWFEMSKKSMIELLIMTHFFVSERTQKDVMRELNVSADTVCDWRQFFREVCYDACVNDGTMIGGSEASVEVDEYKFGKRMHNRGKGVDGKWVFGGIERGSRNCFLRVVETRDAETLLGVIKTSILPGTTIYSDCWQSYKCLEDEGFKDLALNHNLNFKDLETNMHRNGTEGTWGAVKRNMPKRTVSDCFDFYIAEYIWRRINRKSDDLMRTFLEHARKVYPPREKD